MNPMEIVAGFRPIFQGSADTLWLACAQRAMSWPRDPMSWYDFASLCRERGDLEGWRKAVTIAFRLEHVTYEQRRSRACAKLTLGDWEGWSDYEARQFSPRFYRSAYTRRLRWTRPAWRGSENLRDQTLLVLHEQGFGDTIQMLRYVPVLARTTGRILLVVQSELVDFASANFGTFATVMARDADWPPDCDYYVRIMSLPALIGELPAFAPLSAPTSRVPEKSTSGRLRGGICWAGDPKHPRDSQRSVALSLLAPVLPSFDVDWYSLQVGTRAADGSAYCELTNPDPPLKTFGESAALISTLDFVITVDTAVCHLAGSLGVRTFLMLPCAADWRWGLEQETLWYPTVRLVRQSAPGAWQSVLQAVSRELSVLTRIAR